MVELASEIGINIDFHPNTPCCTALDGQVPWNACFNIKKRVISWENIRVTETIYITFFVENLILCVHGVPHFVIGLFIYYCAF
mgnify:CR=1 FL=1